jgi:hypothetical protein
MADPVMRKIMHGWRWMKAFEAFKRFLRLDRYNERWKGTGMLSVLPFLWTLAYEALNVYTFHFTSSLSLSCSFVTYHTGRLVKHRQSIPWQGSQTEDVIGRMARLPAWRMTGLAIATLTAKTGAANPTLRFVQSFHRSALPPLSTHRRPYLEISPLTHCCERLQRRAAVDFDDDRDLSGSQTRAELLITLRSPT